MKNDKAKKAMFAVLVAGGLLGTQAAQASVTTPITTPSVPNRVAAVRAAMSKKVAEVEKLGQPALDKLPYAQMEVASWLNWGNWNNWNNWRNWQNWANWLNY